MEKILFFIPARGNSKGLPRKNIRLMASKPLIAWTIEAALQSGIKGRVVVSTDSAEISEIAVKYGAEVPALRPAELALDKTPTMDVVFDFLKKEKVNGYVPETIVILQPTSPLRTAKHISKALDFFNKSGFQSVVSVCEVEHHPYWSNTLPPNLSMDSFLKREVIGKGRQDFPPFYRINGAIYIANVATLEKDISVIYGKGGAAYIMDSSSSVDIDTEEDFLYAEWLLNRNLKK
ncbi:MAG: cytidylyltransferase domain-containing protein [Flavobacteriales bacterium]